MAMTMEKIQAYAFYPNSKRKLRLEIQKRKKSERLQVKEAKKGGAAKPV